MQFQYLEPKNIEDAINFLTKYGNKARVIAGGTDVVPQIRKKVTKPEYLVDITRLIGLDHVNYDDIGGLKIGALTLIRDLERSSDIEHNHPIIAQAASMLGSMTIRNIATVGGNLCNSSPSAEMAPAFLALTAQAKVVGPDGERLVPLNEFFIGPGENILSKNELLLEIQVPALPPSTGCSYIKHAIRGSIDLAIVSVAAVITTKPESMNCMDIKIALGAVASTPIRAFEAEHILRGRKLDEILIARAAQAASAESCCLSDVRASAWYREEIIKTITKQVIGQAINQIKQT